MSEKPTDEVNLEGENDLLIPIYIKHVLSLSIASVFAIPVAFLIKALVILPILGMSSGGRVFNNLLFEGMLLIIVFFGPFLNKILFLCILAPYLTVLEYFKNASFLSSILGITALSALGPLLSKTFRADVQKGDFLIHPLTTQFCLQGFIAVSLIYGVQSFVRRRRTRAQQERMYSE